MPLGDSHHAFAEAAARDGIELILDEAFPWLTETGHIMLEELAEEPPDGADARALGRAAETLDELYRDLGGDIDTLVNCRITLYGAVDLVHLPSNTLIEIDEAHHFTSFRLLALDSYPADVKLGFDTDAYRELCRSHAAKYDKFSRLPAKGFGFGGLAKERAYKDALRDLATPAIGLPPLTRLTALDGDGAAAYEREKDKLRELLGLQG